LPTPQDAAPIVRKLLEAVNEPVVVQGQPFRLTACVGIATYPQDAQDERSLMKHAQLALRAAKRDGTNKQRFFDAITKARAERSPA